MAFNQALLHLLVVVHVQTVRVLDQSSYRRLLQRFYQRVLLVQHFFHQQQELVKIVDLVQVQVL